MQKDIIFLDEIMSLKDKKEIRKRNFFWLYPFTNENIKAYYSFVDFNGKDILCVASSGDHALNAILKGANKISCFDINPLAKYFVELKIAAIKSLTLEEFILFFYSKKIFTYKHFFNKKTYDKFSNNLNDKYKEFWDYFFNKYTKTDIFKSYLISDDYLILRGLLEVNSYLDEKNYYKLRNLLNNKTINYYDINLNEFNKINDKFDILILSNVPAFLERIYDKDILKSFKECIDSVSKDNTRVIVNYFYDLLLQYISSNSNVIYQEDKVSKFFIAEDYEYKSIESAFNTQLRKGFRRLSNNYDSILISKDKK